MNCEVGMERKIGTLLYAAIIIMLLTTPRITYYPSTGYGGMYGGDLSPEWRCDRFELNTLKGVVIE